MKHIQRFSMLLCLLASSIYAAAYDIYSNGIYYNVVSESEKTVEVTHGPNYNEYVGDITLTGYVDGFKVVAIGQSAFWNCGEMTSVTIPSTVTRIDDSAFAFSGITSFTLPHTVTEIIGNPFRGCLSLNNLYVEDWGGRYGNGTNGANCIVEKETQTLVAGCKNSVIPTDVTIIGPYSFENCYGLTSITIPDNVTRIEEYAFNNCNGLSNVDLPYSLESIGSRAFGWCTNLTSVWLPSSVTSMGNDNPWESCQNLQTIEVDGANTVYDSREGCNAIVETATGRLVAGCQNTTFPFGITTIGRDAFHYQNNLTGIDIPEGVTTIEYEAFEGCGNLQWVNLPSTLETVEAWAFTYCVLTSVYIPANVSYIEAYAFYYNQQLQDVYIGSGVQNIGSQAFDYCPNLRNVYCYAENPPTIYENTFGGTNASNSNTYPSNMSLNVPKGCISLYQTANYWSEFGSYSDPLPSNDVHKWGDLYYAILSEEDMTVEVSPCPEGEKYSGYITIPSMVGGYTVTSIGNSAFANCTEVTGVSIPETITRIGESGFYCCTALTDVTIPANVTELGNLAFWGCSNLSSVSMARNGLVTIGNAVFAKTAISYLTIPNTVTSIGTALAWGCPNLESIVVRGSNTTYDSRESCNAIIETATNKMIASCKRTFIPDGVEVIDQNAFAFCYGLTEIEFPSSVKVIDYDAIWGCSDLEKVTFNEGLKTIYLPGFFSCGKLKSLVIPASVDSIAGGSAIAYVVDSYAKIEELRVVEGNTRYDSRENCNAIIETATNTLIVGCMNTTIPSGTKVIGGSAFREAGLTSITIPATVDSIARFAFRENELSTIKVYSMVPPLSGLAAFDASVYEDAVLYVPAGTKDLYAAANGWSRFQDIRDELMGNGRFYLQNMANGKYWGAGNDWGTQATLVDHPEFVDLAALADGRYTIEGQVNNGGQQYYFNGDYMDWAIASAAPVTMTEVSEGIYTIANDSAFYGWDGASTVLSKTLTDATSPNAQWRVIAEKEMKTSLGGATYSNPVDATFLIQDAGLGRNNRYYSAWQWEHSGNVNHNNAGANENFCVESYHVPFRFSQTLTDVPNGVYELTAQGFYRQDGSDANNLPYLFMNGDTQTLSPSMESENSMAEASGKFSAGKYGIAPIIVKVTDHTITLGVELVENTGLWCIWDNFELTYYGDTEIDAVKNMALLNQLRDLRRTAQSLQGNAGISEAADNGLASALAETADPDYSQAGLTQAIEVLSTAINRAQAAIAAQPKIEAANEEMAATNVYTAEALAAYKAVYDEAQQKYDEGTLTLEEANALENPHLFTFDQQGGNNILKNLLLSAWSVNADAASESTTNLRHQYVSGVNYLRYSTTNEDAVVTATIPNVADGTYAVTVDVETSASEGVLTLQVGEGTATNVVANQVEANGVVSGGVLTITFNVPADLSWFRFRNMVYTRTGDADGGYAKALETIVSGKEYLVSTVYNDNTYYLKENGYLTDELAYAGVFRFDRAEQEGTYMPVGWMLNNASGWNFTNGGNQNNVLVDNYYIHTSTQARKAWEGQVFYLGGNDKYAVRGTNAASANWGASAFWTVIDDTDADNLPQAAYTLEGMPYIWNLVEPADNQSELREMADLRNDIRAAMARIRAYAATVEEESESAAKYVGQLNANFNDFDGQLDGLNTLADLQDAMQWVKEQAAYLVKNLASVEDGRNVTDAFIANAKPTANANYWTVTNGEGNPASPNAFDPTNDVAEFWNQAAYSLSQQLYLPAGDYVLSVVALTRAAGTASNYTFDDMQAILRAGEAETQIALADPSVINSRTQANEWFNEGNGVTELPFTVAADGNVTISLTADATQQDYWLVWRNFSLRYIAPAAPERKYGDVNGDEKVNVGDVTAIYNVMLGKTVNEYADVNGDTKTNVGDVTAVYNVMLGKVATVKGEQMFDNENIDAESFADESLMASLTSEGMTVGIDNSRIYTAFQMVVTLPEGMNLKDVNLNASRKADHQMMWDKRADGRYLVMVVSPTSSDLNNTTDDLLTFNFEGKAQGMIAVDEVVFVTADEQIFDVEGITIDAATGIMAIDNGQQTMDNCYDLSGRRVLKPTKGGVYIINGKKTYLK